MSVLHHPKTREVLECDFSFLKTPEITKSRPVVILAISGSSAGSSHRCAVEHDATRTSTALAPHSQPGIIVGSTHEVGEVRHDLRGLSGALIPLGDRRPRSTRQTTLPKALSDFRGRFPGDPLRSLRILGAWRLERPPLETYYLARFLGNTRLPSLRVTTLVAGPGMTEPSRLGASIKGPRPLRGPSGTFSQAASFCTGRVS